jgi:hypothetical protein
LVWPPATRRYRARLATILRFPAIGLVVRRCRATIHRRRRRRADRRCCCRHHPSYCPPPALFLVDCCFVIVASLRTRRRSILRAGASLTPEGSWFDGRGGSCRRDPLLWGRGEEVDG